MSGSYKLIIFDLDGTVSDSFSGILHCFKRMLEHYNVDYPGDDEMGAYLHGSVHDHIRKLLNTDDKGVSDALEIYRDYYISEGEAMCKPFDGAENVFRELKKAGYLLGVATMKIHNYAVMQLEHWGFLDYFDTVHGADPNGMMDKSDLIHMCLKDVNVEPRDALMIGDSVDDLLNARKASVPFLAASYGSNLSPSICEDNGIDYVRSIRDVVTFIVG